MAERTIAGLDVLRARLEALRTDAARKSLGFATRKGAAVVRDAIEARAPRGTVPHKTYKGRLVAPGFLSRSIGMKSFNRRDGQGSFARIGPRAEAFYGSQFVEIGTSKMPAQRFMVPAYEDARGEVEATFVRELRRAIDRAVKRGAVR